MIYRIKGTTEVFNRVKEGKSEIGLVSFAKGPVDVPDHESLPMLVMAFGEDVPIKKSSRGDTGFPQVRSVEVFLDVINTPKSDLESMAVSLRNFVLKDVHPVKDDNGDIVKSCYLLEKGFLGPMPFGVPGLSVMRLSLELIYTDKGPEEV